MYDVESRAVDTLSTPKTPRYELNLEGLAARVIDFVNQTQLGLSGLASAADVIAADCRFNSWVAEEVKKVELGLGWWSRFLDGCKSNDERCAAAMTAYATGGTEDVFCWEMDAVAAFLNHRSMVCRGRSP